VDAANTTLRWYIGRPSLHNDREPHHWVMYAFDPSETPKARRAESGVDG
jgi:hypothetical protein